MQVLVVLIVRTPSKTMLPDRISSPFETLYGKLSPVRLCVSSILEPSNITPSNGTFSPARTIIVEPSSTSSGEILSSLPSTKRLAYSGCKLVSSSIDLFDLFTAKPSKILPIEYRHITIKLSIYSPMTAAPTTERVISIFSFTLPLNNSLIAFK